MKYLILFLFILFLFNLADAQNNESYVISIDQNIDAGASNFLSRSIDEAIAKNYKNFVIVLNTFGGDSLNMEKMIKKIQEAEGKGLIVITLVAPRGAHATSAGSFIALASTKIYMVRGTSIGSATPVLGTLDEDVKRKVTEAFAAYARALAESKGRNATAAAEMVLLGKSYTAEEAYALNLIDGVLNSSTVEGALKELGISYERIVNPDFSSQFLSVLSDPSVAAILSFITVFALLYGIITQSEILIATGIVSLILTLVSYSIVSPFIGAVLLFLIGAILILVELKIGEGLGVIPAAIFMAIGFILFYVPITPPEIKPGELPKISFTGIGISQYAVAAAILILGSILGLYLHKIAQTVKKKTAIMDIKKLINEVGYALTDIAPGKPGVVSIQFEEWTAKSNEEIPKDSKVLVLGIEGNMLIVKKVE